MGAGLLGHTLKHFFPRSHWVGFLSRSVVFVGGVRTRGFVLFMSANSPVRGVVLFLHFSGGVRTFPVGLSRLDNLCRVQASCLYDFFLAFVERMEGSNIRDAVE